MANFRELTKKTFGLAFPTTAKLWDIFVRVLGWVAALAIAFGVEWIAFDWTIPMPIGETGYSIQAGPIIIAASCVIAVCFAIAWNTVPQLEIVDFRFIRMADSTLYIVVKNLSSNKSVEQPVAKFALLDDAYSLPPIALLRENEQFNYPKRDDIAPGDKAFFQFIKLSDGDWIICAECLRRAVRIKPDNYDAELLITGKDIPSKTRKIIIKRNLDGTPSVKFA
jgi:hypothetical protein